MMKAEFERACWLANEHTIHRYLMANAHGRQNGFDKATNHAKLCEFYVHSIVGLDTEYSGKGDHYDLLRNATQNALTDRMDEVIGFPLDKRPDYEVLARLFFDVWHKVALQVLVQNV